MKFTILGLLVDKPMHGYQLKRVLSPGLSNDRLVNDGVLYPLLKKLEREGLVRGEVVQVGNAPRRRVFRPTRKGRAAFLAWLEGGGGEEDEVKYDFFLGHPFLNKCLFFGRLERSAVLEKLVRQKESALSKRREFRRIRDGMVRRGVDRFRIAILELGMAQHEQKIRWLQRLIEELRGAGGGRAGGAAGAPRRKRSAGRGRG